MNAIRESRRIAGPLILTNMSVPLLGMVDTAVVGHLPEPRYLAAVALGASVMSALYFLFGFLRMGTTALAAQALGAGDNIELRTGLVRALLVAVALGLLLILLGPLVIAGARALFAPTPDVAGDFGTYVGIRLLGAPAALSHFVIFGWFLGLQDSRRPLIIVIATNLVNAVLAVLFVWGFGFRVAGVAAATTLSDFLALGLGLLYVRPRWLARGGMPARADVWVRQRFERLFKVNRDLFLRSLMLEAAFILVTAIGSREGEVVLAANAVLLNLFTLAAYVLDAFAQAAEAMVGKAVGGRDIPGFRAAVQAGVANAAVLAVLMTLAFAVGGGWLVNLLTGLPEVRQEAGHYLVYASLLPIVSVWAFLLDGVYFGATRTAELRNAMAVSLALFVAFLAALVPPFANHGLWAAFLAFLAVRGLLLWLVYRWRGAAFVAA